MRRPPDAQHPPVAGPGGVQGTAGGADRRNETTSPVRHDPATRTLGPVLRARARGDLPSPVAFIGTPARQVAGEILAGAKLPAEIAVELVDVLGPHTAILLAHEIAARIAAASQEDTL